MGTTRRSWAGVGIEERRRVRRERLLTAGTDLIGAPGGAIANVRAVCRAAELTERYFYESFTDRDTFVLEVYAHVAKQAREALASRAVLAYVAVPTPGGGQQMFGVDGTPGTEHHGTLTSTALLNALVDTYKADPQVSIHRTNFDVLSELAPYYENISGLVVFPSYTPDDILELAGMGNKVPTGITRHIISPRALRVNVPLALLAGPEPLDEKNAWWHEQFKRKLAGNEVRLYRESTYLFDE